MPSCHQPVVNINDSNYINNFSVSIFNSQSHINQVLTTGVSEGVSQSGLESNEKWRLMKIFKRCTSKACSLSSSLVTYESESHWKFSKSRGKVHLARSPSSPVVTCHLSRELHLSPPHSPGHRKSIFFLVLGYLFTSDSLDCQVDHRISWSQKKLQ